MKSYPLAIGLLIAFLVLSFWIAEMNSEIRSIENQVQEMKDDLNSTQAEVEDLRGLTPDDSWKPAMEDLTMVYGPRFTALPYQEPSRPEWYWQVDCEFEVKNTYRESLIVLFEIRFTCDPDVCISTYQPYAKRGFGEGGGIGGDWTEGWRKLWFFDSVPRENVVLVPREGRIPVKSLGAMFETREKVFPEVEYMIRGTALQLHDNLFYLFVWDLGQGILNQHNVTIPSP